MNSTMYTRIAGIFALMLAVVAPTVVLAAHPAQGYEPRDISHSYAKGYYCGLDVNDLTFVEPEDQTPISNLSNIERYMVGGVQDSSLGGSLGPWYVSVYWAAISYYKKYGTLPDTLSLDILKQIPATQNLKPDMLEIYRNPITGEWPKLNSTVFSPGNLYMRPLTTPEMQYFAFYDTSCRKIWFDNVTLDVECIKKGCPPQDCDTVPVKLDTPPFYLRVYGKSSILFTSILTHATE
jgi:hypothetical protein